MKKHLIVISLIIFVTSCQQKVQNNQQPVSQSQDSDRIDVKIPVVNVNQLELLSSVSDRAEQLVTDIFIDVQANNQQCEQDEYYNYIRYRNQRFFEYRFLPLCSYQVHWCDENSII